MKRIVVLIFVASVFISGCKTSEKHICIYTIGDSTMANKTSEVYPETGWGQVLQQYFDSTVSIKNYAVNGRSSKSFIDEGRWQVVFDSLKPGDYVFIQFGHNDEKDYDTTRYTLPFESYSENLRKFVNESRSKSAIPVLFTSIVRRKFGNDGKLMDTHGDYPEAVRKIALEMGVPLIDLQKITEVWVNKIGDEPSKEMFLWTLPDEKFQEGRKDDTHLSNEGAKKVAFLALQECRRQNLGFADRLIIN